jgi:hypothetical protein
MVHLRFVFADNSEHNITTFVPLCKRFAVLLVLSLCTSGAAVAGFERTTEPPRALIGGAGGWFTDPEDAFRRNPSFLAAVKGCSSTVFYHPSPFGLAQLSGGGVLVVLPTEYGPVACCGTTTGFSLYREVTGTAAASYRLNESLAIGTALTIDHVSIARYGSAAAVEIDLGFSALLSEVCNWNVAVTNIGRATLGSGKDPLPQFYSTGIEYAPLPELHIVSELVKEIRYPASLGVSAVITPLDAFSISAGVCTEPSRFCGGVEVSAFSLRLGYAVLTHAELGLSHIICCSFQF